MSHERVAVVVPSLEPLAELLLPFLTSLRARGFHTVVVVDDGSPREYAAVFQRARAELGCTVLRHEVNQGKGAALRTGIAHCLQDDGVTAVVTADSDGQHSPADLVRVAQRVDALGPGGVVFGSRTFDGPGVPVKSRRGNQITTAVVRLLFARHISDTQTGLRGFSRDVARRLLAVRGDRFDYEMNVLLWLITHRVPITEVPVQTIYHDVTNSVTHFRPVRDSALIYSIILRQFAGFAAASVSGAVIDLAAYVAILDGVFHSATTSTAIVVSVVAARLLSASANFALNRWLVFRDDSRVPVSAARYVALAAALLGASALGSTVLSHLLGGHAVWAKIIVDAALFVVSYVVQKRWVFAGGRARES